MTYLLHGFGVFLGVLAGTCVTILTQRFLAWRAEKQQTKNLKFELELNVAKIDTWLADLEKFRDAVNGDALHNWAGYLDFGKTISVTANAMFVSGLLYKKLDKADIAALQELFHELSPNGEQYMNNSLVEYRRLFTNLRTQNQLNEWAKFHKPEAVNQANFWKKKLCGHHTKLQEIIEKLP